MEDNKLVRSVAEAILILAVFAAIAVLALRFIRFCLADLAESQDVHVLTRQAWTVVITFMVPFGGMFYLLYGRGNRRFS